MERKILIGAALPYANGSLHLGHVTGLLGSDILARYFRLNSDLVLFVSGSDCHGTPIAFEAEKRKISPSEIAEKYHNEFKETLINGLGFSYDIYTKTTSKKHHEIVQDIFLKLYEKEIIYKKTEKLPYCNNCNKFLPDRYIEGKCYLCNFESARGDQCDSCGSLINTRELIEPKCKICGETPQWRDSEHFFLKLTAFESDLKKWVGESKGWRLNAKNFTSKLLEQGLIDRSITRDIEWGIPVPVKGYESKKLYVWFEAVCAYLSGSREWADKKGNENKWKDFWKNKEAIHYYVHGKDNIPFHSIIWPSILMAYQDLHLPDKIISSEYLTLEKKQFSKSRNWAVWIPDFLENFNAETLRYYLVINGSETSDSDFSWNDFQTRINSELIGNFGNYIYRILSFIDKKFPEGVNFPEKLDEKSSKLIKMAEDSFSLISSDIENGYFRKGLRQILKLAEEGNRYIDEASPWSTIKKEPKKTEYDLAVAAHLIKCFSILINPFLPEISRDICNQLNLNYSDLKWEYPSVCKTKTNNPKVICKRIEDEEIEKEISKLENTN